MDILSQFINHNLSIVSIALFFIALHGSILSLTQRFFFFVFFLNRFGCFVQAKQVIDQLKHVYESGRELHYFSSPKANFLLPVSVVLTGNLSSWW